MLQGNLQTAVNLQLYQNYTPLQVMFKDSINSSITYPFYIFKI